MFTGLGFCFFAARHDAASSHPPHPLPPVPDAFGQADRLHVQGTMPAAGERKCKDFSRVIFYPGMCF